MRSIWPRSTKPRLIVIFSLSTGFGRSLVDLAHRHLLTIHMDGIWCGGA